MKKNANKLLTFGAALIIATLSMSSAFADGAQKFKIRFAGGFIQNLQQLQINPATGEPTGVETRSLAMVKGSGTFGKVDGMAVSVSGPPVSDQSCPEGLTKIADIVENPFVLTFTDLSMLYGNGSGVVCLNPADPYAPPIAEIDGTWDGGTGRFEGAGGDWALRFDLTVPVGVTTQFMAETGVVTGTITR